MKGIWKRFALWTASGLHFVDNFVLRVKSGAPSPAVAAFHAVVLSGEVPLSVDFVNESIGATSFSWSFGDGGASTETSPSHVYAQAGTYTVVLTATGPGGTDVLTRPEYISVSSTTAGTRVDPGDQLRWKGMKFPDVASLCCNPDACPDPPLGVADSASSPRPGVSFMLSRGRSCPGPGGGAGGPVRPRGMGGAH